LADRGTVLKGRWQKEGSSVTLELDDTREDTMREMGKGDVNSILPSGVRVQRAVKMRLRTKIRLYERFKRRCRN